MASQILKEMFREVEKIILRLNTIQKGIVIEISAIILGLLIGLWWPLLLCTVCILLASISIQKLLNFNRSLDILEPFKFARNFVRLRLKFFNQDFLCKRRLAECQTQDNHQDVNNSLPANVYKADDSSSTPEVEVNLCLQYVKRDFLHSWYSYISEEDIFIEEAEQYIDNLAVTVIERLKTVSVLEHLPFYLDLIRQHVADYHDAINRISIQPNVRRKKDRSKEFKKIQGIDKSFNYLGKFHLAAKKDGQLQLQYLRVLVDAIMKMLISADVYKSRISKELLLEILTSSVLSRLVDLFCEPSFIHKAIILILSDEELIDSKRPGTFKTLAPDHESADQIEKYTLPPPKPQIPENKGSASSEIKNRTLVDEKAEQFETQTQQEINERVHSRTILISNKSEYEVAQEILAHGKLTMREEANGATLENPMYPNDIYQPEKGEPVSLKYDPRENKQMQDSLSSSEEVLPEINFRPSFFIGDEDERIQTNVPHEAATDLSHRLGPEGSTSCDNLDAQSASNDSNSMDRMTHGKSTQKTVDGLASIQFGQGDVAHNLGIANNFDRCNSSEKIYQNKKISDIYFPHVSKPLRRSSSSDRVPANMFSSHSFEGSVKKTNQINTGVPHSKHKQIRNGFTISGDMIDSLNTGSIEVTQADMPTFLCEEVSINTTEEMAGPAMSVYTLYVIKYKSWHFEEEVWVLRQSTVRRRYREFVTLQERLEEHPIYKNKIKGVKGPHRWKIISIKQLERKGVEERRVFLENYLRILIHCDQVGNSLAIREFLAYEEDARIAFVKQSREFRVPRIDKILSKTVSGVIDILTGTGKSGPLDSLSRNLSKSKLTKKNVGENYIEPANLFDPDEITLNFGFQHSEQIEIQTMENVLTQHIHDHELLMSVDARLHRDSSLSSDVDSDIESFHDAMEDKALNLLQRSEGDGCDNLSEISLLDETAPLTSALLELAVMLCQGNSMKIIRENVISSLKIAAGKPLEKFVNEEVNDLLTEERWCRYIKLLSETIWPDGQLDTEATPELSEEKKATRKEQAKQCIQNFFPDVIRILGREYFEAAINKSLEILDHKSLNRHLIFTLLDNIVETIFPEISTSLIQDELLSTPCRKKIAVKN